MNLSSVWQSDAADIARDNRKRNLSPASYFLSQGRALVLAADYFQDIRLANKARGGVASKHRHRIHLALYGQLMAAFEFLLKDFVASAINAVTLFDEPLHKAKWLTIDVERVLVFRSAIPSPGALLVHPTQGWHDSSTVNDRYKSLFQYEPILKEEIQTLDQLWILRHSVAHNAGYVTAYDARRAGLPELSEHVAAISSTTIHECFDFLALIAGRLASDVGGRILRNWLMNQGPGKSYLRDKEIYSTLKLLATCVTSRSKDLPTIRKGMYSKDFDHARRHPTNPIK